VRGARVGAGEGEEPVQVGVLQPGHEPAGEAGPARPVRRPRRLAEEELREPEAEPLLADARRAVEEDRLREPLAEGGPDESLPRFAVPAEGGEAHGVPRRWSQVSGSTA